MKTTPFHESSLKCGAKMVEAFGYWLPWEYSSGHAREHIATRENASLCDLDYMGEFLVEGPDALRLVQKIATNDFARKAVGSIQYTALCDDAGNMVDDCTIWRVEEESYMVVSGSEDDYSWIVQQARGFDVRVTNITSRHTTLALQGPLAGRVLQGVTDLDLARIGYYRFMRADISGIDCLVARMGYTGESGYEIHFASTEGPAVWDLILKAGQASNMVPCGQAALESLRQEAGYLLVGNEHDRNTNPLEAGIGFTVKFDKDDFIGKAALQRIARDGVKRRLVWLDVPSGALASKGDKVLVSGRQVGTVTSGSFSPTRNRGTAMAYVDVGHTIPGLTVEIATQGGESVSAKLSVMPLYDPGDVRTKGAVAASR